MRVLPNTLILLALSAATAAAQTPPQNQVSDTTIQQLKAIETEKAQRTPTEKKISSQLLDALTASGNRPSSPARPLLRPMAQAQSNGKVLLLVKGNITPQLQEFITGQGGTAMTALPKYKMLSVELPLSAVEAVAARPEVRSIDISPRAITNQASGGLQDPEGDLAHAAQDARTQFNTTGAGVKVCVMSDSVRYLAQAQANGSLGPVRVPDGASGVETGPNPRDEGEGTAMLEIVHRLAPGAALEFATANPAATDMIRNIDGFRLDGCTIIVDDITYPDESPFEDGPIADSVTDATNAGILYFSSAANSGNKVHGTSGTWEGDFKPSSTTFTVQGKTYTFHEFAPGVVYDVVSHVQRPLASLFWDDPLGAATNEYQLAVVDANNNVVSHSDTDINGMDDPLQNISIQNGDRIAILQAPGAKNRFLHLTTNRARLAQSTSGATQGHNSFEASNAFSVASISAQNQQAKFTGGTNVSVDDWSSDGPRRMFYDADGNPYSADLSASGGWPLRKPDLAAADCVTTDVPVSALSTFCGTSAAAPHAAAIAALIKSAHPELSAGEIRSALTSTPLDIEAPGWDNVSGLGIVMPGPALAAADVIARQPFVDLMHPAIVARNATVTTSPNVAFWPLASGYQFRAPNSRMSVTFSAAQAGTAMKLVMVHCTTTNWPRVGYAPVTIKLNDVVIAANFDVSAQHGGNRDYVTDNLTIPTGAIRQGTNILTIESQPGMRTTYWLRSVRLVTA